tara:strand:+ start:64 stop:789 length:726 start_codon:yes stop_codon:yes gene_type:complete
MSIASQLYRQQAAQQARDVRQMSALSALESEKALERAQAGRDLDEFEKRANFLMNLGKYGGTIAGLAFGPAGGIFAPAIGTALGQALATGISSRGAKKLEDKYGSGYLAGTFGDIEGDVLKSGLARAGLSGIQSALMAKFAPSSSIVSKGKEEFGKVLGGLKEGKSVGPLEGLLTRLAPEALESGPDGTILSEGLTSAQIENILSDDKISKEVGIGSTILEGLYDLGFGSPKFQYELEGGR